VNVVRENTKVVLKTWVSRKFCILPGQWPKTFSKFVIKWFLYNCPNVRVIKTPPQSLDLNVIKNIWAKLETEIKNHSVSKKIWIRVWERNGK
jgi:hypothetical protein